MPNVKDFNFLPVLQNPIYYAIDVRFMAVKEVPQLFTFADQGTPVRLFFQAEIGLFKGPIPFEGRVGGIGLLL